MEIPELVKLHKEFRGEGFGRWSVFQPKTRKLRRRAYGRFAQDFKMDYPVGWVSQDVARSL